jgi:Zn-dependent peptidase ImmA (M78 family)
MSLSAGCVERVAAELTKQFKLEAAVDPFRLSRALGVTSFRSIQMSESGRLIRSAGETVIYVRRGMSPERRRFTVAHEVGHLILEPEVSTAFRDSPPFSG